MKFHELSVGGHASRNWVGVLEMVEGDFQLFFGLLEILRELEILLNIGLKGSFLRSKKFRRAKCNRAEPLNRC